MGNTPLQARLVSSPVRKSNQSVVELSLFDASGAARVVPSRAAARADVAAATSAQISGGEDPTQAEYNALQADYVALRTAFNDLLAKLRTANVIAT